MPFERKNIWIRKNYIPLFGIIFIIFILGFIIYPIFYTVTDDPSLEQNAVDTTPSTLKDIDVLSNLSFFKILVADNSSKDGPKYSERFVTIRDEKTIETLREMLSTAIAFEPDNPRGYDVPTTALCYLEDNSMYSFFVIDSNIVVFSDSDYNKTMYKLDEQYNIEEFLTKLYTTNVNSYTYSIISKNKKYGIKYSNKTIIEPLYDSVTIINPKIDVFAVTLNEITTFIDQYGENPFPNFDIVEVIPATDGKEDWYENALKFNQNGKYGLISLDGTILIFAECDNIEALNYEKNYLKITQGGKERVIKLLSSGYEDFTADFDSIEILGVDLNYDSSDQEYRNSDSTILVGINNGIREQYYEIKK